MCLFAFAIFGPYDQPTQRTEYRFLLLLCTKRTLYTLARSSRSRIDTIIDMPGTKVRNSKEQSSRTKPHTFFFFPDDKKNATSE